MKCTICGPGADHGAATPSPAAQAVRDLHDQLTLQVRATYDAAIELRTQDSRRRAGTWAGGNSRLSTMERQASALASSAQVVVGLLQSLRVATEISRETGN